MSYNNLTNNLDGVGKSMMFEGKTDKEKEALHQKCVDHITAIGKDSHKKLSVIVEMYAPCMITLEDFDTIAEELS